LEIGGEPLELMIGADDSRRGAEHYPEASKAHAKTG